MANTISYPKATAKSDDLVLGTSMPLPNSNEDPRTVNFSIGQINGLANSPDIATKTILVTDAQLRTLGTTPVVILPGVVGYGYQILGLTTQVINAGTIADSYDWGAQDGLFSWRTTLFTGTHRVEIPSVQLPSGGAGLSSGIYVGTPIAGDFRSDAALVLGVTSNTNPTIGIGESPSATWTINVTYRSIKGS